MKKEYLVGLLAALFLAQASVADPTQSGPSPMVSPAAPAPSASPTAVPPSAGTPAAAAPQPEEDTASYVQGYSDGCASANLRYARQEHVKPNRDAQLFDSDKGYHDGWDHGYRKCEDKISPGGLSVPANSVVM